MTDLGKEVGKLQKRQRQYRDRPELFERFNIAISLARELKDAEPGDRAELLHKLENVLHEIEDRI